MTKSKMAAAAILKFCVNGHNLAAIAHICTTLPYLTLPSGRMTPGAKPALRPPSGPIAHPRKAKGYNSLPKALTSLVVKTKQENSR